MNITPKILAAAAICFLGGASLFATSITLTGTVRDFAYTGTTFGGLTGHPDFEAVIATDPGIVKTTLGVDGTPDYAPATSSVSTHGVTAFNQWFHDTPGVNYSTTYAITLNETSPGSGTFSYDSSAFFPIDGLLAGNQSSGHNYGFTYQIHTTFTYASTQIFSFTGDDDVFVFIDKKLAIDLGGVHGPQSASIVLSTLGLTVGNTYDFDFFFAERHTSGSNLKIETSIPLVTNNVPETGVTLVYVLLAFCVMAAIPRVKFATRFVRY